MRQIVCISTSNWDEHPTSKQQILSRMPDAEILYFDPPITMLAPFKDKEAKPRMSKYREEPSMPHKHITVYATPPILPLYNKNRTVNRMNQRRLASFIREKMKKHGFVDPILWVYHPSYIDAVDLIPHSSLVYHCIDRHSQYPGLINPALVDGMEAELAKKADVIFATAKGLLETLEKFNDNVHFLPNGVDYELFRKVDSPGLPIPNDLFNIKKPIFGFTGALQECIAYDYVDVAAERHPEWSFVFIGPVHPGVDLSKLQNRQNIYFLKRVPIQELVSYLACFDVCLNIFVENKLAKDVSPLKFYEYLVTGKPIITGVYPEQVMQYKDVVRVVRNADEFERQCAAAIEEQDETLAEKRKNYAREASWDNRVVAIQGVLKEKGIFS